MARPQRLGRPPISVGRRESWPSRLPAYHLSSVACVGCGWCCLSDQCPPSHRLHGYMPRCPEVFWDEAAARYFCRLATQEEYRFSLAVGEGCCARFNSWRNDVRNRDQD